MDLERFQGCLVGLAVGDSLGMPAEGLSQEEVARLFGRIVDLKDGWLPAGYTTDDTAQALILAESLVGRGYLDADDVARRLLEWYSSCPPDIGTHTRRVLSLMEAGMSWQEATAEVERRYQPLTAGNGSLMRCAPVAMRYANDLAQLLEASHLSSQITHPHPLACYSCAFFNCVLSRVLRGYDKFSAFSFAMEVMAHAPYELLERVEGVPSKSREELSPTGFVLDTLECALWAWWNFNDWAEAIIALVNMGGDTDTNAAVAGALLGAQYGLGSIPEKWRFQVKEVPRCLELAERLLALARGDS